MVAYPSKRDLGQVIGWMSVANTAEPSITRLRSAPCHIQETALKDEVYNPRMATPTEFESPPAVNIYVNRSLAKCVEEDDSTYLGGQAFEESGTRGFCFFEGFAKSLEAPVDPC